MITLAGANLNGLMEKKPWGGDDKKKKLNEDVVISHAVGPPLGDAVLSEATCGEAIYILYTHPTVFVTVHIPVVFVSGHILEDEEDCADY